MLEAMFRETVTLRKPRVSTRGANARATYEIVRDQAEIPVRIKCKIDYRKDRNQTTQAVEDNADATMIFRVRGVRDVDQTHIVVDQDGQAFRVKSIDVEKSMFGSATYKEVKLIKTTIPVGEDEA